MLRLGGGAIAPLLFFLVSVAWWPGLVAGQLPKWEILYFAILALPFMRFRWDAVTVAVLVAVGWILLTILWSEDQRQSLHQAHKLLTLVGVFFLGRWLGDAPIRWGIAPAMVGILIFGVWGGFYGSFGNENFATEYLLMVLPFLVWPICSKPALMPVKVGLAVLVAAVVAYLFWLPSRIEFYALWMAFMVWVGVYHRPWLIFAVGASIALPLASDTFWHMIEGSVLARAEIHFNTLMMWLEHPLIGQGFGSFNYHYPRFGEEHLALFSRVEVQIGHHAGAAHNDYLQLLAETGLVGFALVGAALWLIFSRVALSPSLMTVLIGGGLCLIGFPAQLPATGALLAYCLGCCAPLSSRGVSIGEAWSGARTFCLGTPTSTLRLHP